MKALITWVMKGRTQAIMATAVSGMLALMITPMALISAALVVLATLRNGAREGLVVVLSAGFAIAGLGGLIFNMPLAMAIMGLVLWLPAWGSGLLLGQSRSLSKTIEILAMAAIGLVVAQYLLLGDPNAYWDGLITEYMKLQFDTAVVPEADQQALATAIAGWMPGGVAASWLSSSSVAVFIALWMQAKLNQSNEFGQAFRAFAVSRVWLWLVPITLLPSLLSDQGPTLLGQLYLVGTTLFLLQGLSVAHAWVHQKGESKRGWIYGLYFVLFVGLPYSVTAIAAAGFADGWLNFRAKIQSKD